MRHSRIIYRGLPCNGVRRFPDINHIWQSNRLLPILYLRNSFLGERKWHHVLHTFADSKVSLFCLMLFLQMRPIFLSLSHHLSGQITENSPENPGFLPKKRFYIHVSWIFSVQSSINFNYTFNNLVSKIEGLEIIYIKDLWPFRPLLTCSYIEGSGTLYQVKLLNITQ